MKANSRFTYKVDSRQCTPCRAYIIPAAPKGRPFFVQVLPKQTINSKLSITYQQKPPPQQITKCQKLHNDTRLFPYSCNRTQKYRNITTIFETSAAKDANFPTYIIINFILLLCLYLHIKYFFPGENLFKQKINKPSNHEQKLSAQKPRRPSGCRGTDRMCQRQGRVPLHRPQSGGMYLPGRGQPTPDGLRHHSSRRMERCSRSFVGNGRKGTRRGEPDYYRRRQYDRQRAGDTHHRLGRRSRTANQNQPARAGQRIRSVPQTRYLLAGSRLVTQRKICRWFHLLHRSGRLFSIRSHIRQYRNGRMDTIRSLSRSCTLFDPSTLHLRPGTAFHIGRLQRRPNSNQPQRRHLHPGSPRRIPV